jgi:hypothetical protein
LYSGTLRTFCIADDIILVGISEVDVFFPDKVFAIYERSSPLSLILPSLIFSLTLMNIGFYFSPFGFSRIASPFLTSYFPF